MSYREESMSDIVKFNEKVYSNKTLTYGYGDNHMYRSALLTFTLLALASPNLLAQTTTTTTTSTPSNAATNPAMTSPQGANAQTQSMSAIDIILQDHAQIKQMITQLNTTLDSDVATSRTNFVQLKNFLINHETMEQTVWYPALAQYKDLKDVISKLTQEEQDVGTALSNLDSVTDDKQWVEQVKKIEQSVAQHAKDEETMLFPKVKKELNDNMLKDIGSQLQNYKTQNPVQTQ